MVCSSLLPASLFYETPAGRFLIQEKGHAMTLRLDLYPPPVLQEHTTTPTLLSCVLHSGELPSDHHLAVWIGGISQPMIQEDQQEVFTWQCEGCK